ARGRAGPQADRRGARSRRSATLRTAKPASGCRAGARAARPSRRGDRKRERALRRVVATGRSRWSSTPTIGCPGGPRL
ncbi:MAG: hypothetical protein AVDCRST_MAG49-3370, partial [uncultured Thermomicrobiales bacterium]